MLSLSRIFKRSRGIVLFVTDPHVFNCCRWKGVLFLPINFWGIELFLFATLLASLSSTRALSVPISALMCLASTLARLENVKRKEKKEKKYTTRRWKGKKKKKIKKKEELTVLISNWPHNWRKQFGDIMQSWFCFFCHSCSLGTRCGQWQHSPELTQGGAQTRAVASERK